MKRIIRSLIIALLLGLHLSLLAPAQEKDPLELARDNPPNLIKADIALEQMEWRLKQLGDTAKAQEMVDDLFEARISHYHDEIHKLTKQLPIELRYANDDVRSKLIGDVLRELMSGRLEVASQEEVIAQYTLALEKSQEDSSKVEEQKQRKHQIQIRANEQKVALAKTNYERTEKLAQKSFVTDSEVNRDKYAYELSKMELEHAILDFEIDQSSRVNDIANRIIEARISLQPAKARVAAAERFMKLFSDSHDHFESISELRRKIASLNEDHKQLGRRKWEIKVQITELEMLLKRTKSASEGLKNKKTDEQ